MQKYLIILLFLVSCTTLPKDVITKKEAYNINSKYIKEKYNVEIDNKKAGFTLNKGIFYFKTRVDDKEYDVLIDLKGNVIESYEILPY